MTEEGLKTASVESYVFHKPTSRNLQNHPYSVSLNSSMRVREALLQRKILVFQAIKFAYLKVRAKIRSALRALTLFLTLIQSSKRERGRESETRETVKHHRNHKEHHTRRRDLMDSYVKSAWARHAFAKRANAYNNS